MNEEKCNCVRCGWCCTDMEINILDLVHPETLLPKKGLEFYKIHGLDKILKENGKVKIVHKCQYLTSQNLCGIEDTKPDFCREWVCRRHMHDQKWFIERSGEFAVSCLEKVAFVMLGSESLEERMEAISLLVDEYYKRIEELKEVKPNAVR